MSQRLGSVAVLLMLLVGCDTSLRDDLTESQANDIVALLQQQGIGASTKRSEAGTWSVVIDDGADRGAEQLIHLYGAPRVPHATIADIFPGTGLLPSELEEHARYQFALGQELAGTIEQIDGVLASRVHVAIPKQNPRAKERQLPTASVFVRYRSDQRVDLMKHQIRTLVAQALPGALVTDVSVMTVPVFPPVKAGGTRMEGGWFGVHYQSEDTGLVLMLLLLPWLLLIGLLGFIGWREDAAPKLQAWFARVMSGRNQAFGFLRRSRSTAGSFTRSYGQSGEKRP